MRVAQSKVTHFFGHLSLVLFVVQILAFMLLIAAFRHDFNLFAGGSASGSGVGGAFLVPLMELAFFGYGVQFTAAVGLLCGLIDLSRPPRNRAGAIVGIVGNLLFVVAAVVFVHG